MSWAFSKKRLAIMVIVMLSLTMFNLSQLSTTNPKNAFEINVQTQKHVPEMHGKFTKSASGKTAFVNTTAIVNDDIYNFSLLNPYFRVKNSTVFINSTRYRKLRVYGMIGIEIENSMLWSLDNSTRYTIEMTGTTFSLSHVVNSTIGNVEFNLGKSANSPLISFKNTTFYDSVITVGITNKYVKFENCTFINSTIEILSSYINITDSKLIDSNIVSTIASHLNLSRLIFRQTSADKKIDLVEIISSSYVVFANNTIYGNGACVTIRNSYNNITIDDNRLYNSSFKPFFSSGTAIEFGDNNTVNDLPIEIYKNTSFVSVKGSNVGQIITWRVDNLSLIDVTAGGLFITETSNILIENYVGRNAGLGIYLYVTENATISQAQIENTGHSLYIKYGNHTQASQVTINSVKEGITISSSEDTTIDKSQVTDVLLEEGIYVSDSNKVILNQITVNVQGRDITIEASENLKLLDLQLYGGGLYPLVSSTAFGTFATGDILLDGVPIEIYYQSDEVNLTYTDSHQIIVIDANEVAATGIHLNGTNVFLNDVEDVLFNDSIIENAYYGIFMYSLAKATVSRTAIRRNVYGIYVLQNNSISKTQLNITESEFTENMYGVHVQNVECWIRENTFSGNSFAIYDSQTYTEGYVFLNSFDENTFDYYSVDPYTPTGLLLSRLYIGNYWDNFTGNDINGDMISESIYPLDGNHTDYAPFVEPPHYDEQINNYTILIANVTWLFRAPERQIVVNPLYTLNGTLLENMTFHYNVSSLSLSLQMVKESYVELYKAFLSLYQSNTTLVYWFEFRYMNKTYYSQPRTFTISLDTLNLSVPNIVDVTFNSSIYTNETLMIVANITDALDLINVQVRYNTSDGWLTKEMMFSETQNQYIATFENLKSGKFTFQIYVENIMGISNTTEYFTVTVNEYEVLDTQPPQIISVFWSPENPYVNSTLAIFAVAVDNAGIQNVTAEIVINGTTEKHLLTKLGNDTYYLTYATPQTPSNISVIVTATDVNGNIATSQTYTITIQNLPSLQSNVPAATNTVNYIIIAVISAAVGAAVSFIVTRRTKSNKRK